MIHSTAIIHPKAQIDENVYIGPYCVIEKNVSIAKDNYLHSHIYIGENTEISIGNEFFSFASIGTEPQDKKFKKGDRVYLKIGSNNIFRECVTINRGTIQDKTQTTIGNNNLLMAYVHIAHDCVLENNIIMANNASLAGHVAIDSYANLGGFSMINQFRTIGKHIFIGMGCAINQNLIPYMTYSHCNQKDVRLRSVNKVGLKRFGYEDAKLISSLKNTADLIKSDLSLDELKQELSQQIAENPQIIELKEIFDFINHQNSITYGICR